ncbi:MAG: hypothetical protein K0S44_771 [Bacteroidetes bacterium]|jgi:hypothetical protein|nr:hypothetical protein [Bacteroidota bacterium]
MRKKIQILALISMVFLSRASAQIIAGSGASGLLISDPLINLSVTSVGSTSSGFFDLDCDSVPDMRVELHKGPTVVDGANTAYLFVLNPSFQVCADTGNSPLLMVNYYNAADTLFCMGTNDWSNDSIFQLGNYGCMDCSGPNTITNKYLSYTNISTSQVGWIRISFNLIDSGSGSAPVTLTIAEILSPCASTAYAIPTGGSGAGTCGIFSYNYSISPPYCAGTCSGSITLSNVTGGTGPYTYSWGTTPVQMGNTINGVCAGQMSVTITDANGTSCTSYFNMPDPAPVDFSFTSPTNVSCYGGNDGSVCVTNITGGPAPYTFNWVPAGGMGQCLTNAVAGTYTLCVTNSNGCMVCKPVTITEPTQITATEIVTNASCSSCCDGSVQVAPSGGTPGYTYLWQPNLVTTPTATDLCTMTYTYCITDANGCVFCDNATVSFSTGIDDLSEDMLFSLFPNPNNGTFSLAHNASECFSLMIMDELGKEVHSAQLCGSHNALELKLENGIYLLRVKTEESGKVIYRKLMIVN